MAGIGKGLGLIPRYEWQLYKKVVQALHAKGARLPSFGDFAVNHPRVLPQDMRLLKPSANIRYTTDDAWLIAKGTNVRKKGGYEQFRYLCKSIVDSQYYMGRQFSYGDEYIFTCASGSEKTGNPTTWRKVGTNHHLEKVVKDIASFCASSGIL